MTKLRKNQEVFLIALMENSTILDACRQAGIASATGYKFLNDPIFKVEYARIRRETLALATNRLQKSAVKAVEVLDSVMSDEETPASARVQASRAILDNAYKAYELDDLAKRIEEMEGQLNE